MTMNPSIENELLGTVEDILNLDDLMRFAAIIDLDGTIIEGIMKEGKTSLESQKNKKNFVKRQMKEGKSERVIIIH